MYITAKDYRSALDSSSEVIKLLEPILAKDSFKIDRPVECAKNLVIAYGRYIQAFERDQILNPDYTPIFLMIKKCEELVKNMGLKTHEKEVIYFQAVKSIVIRKAYKKKKKLNSTSLVSMQYIGEDELVLSDVPEQSNRTIREKSKRNSKSKVISESPLLSMKVIAKVNA